MSPNPQPDARPPLSDAEREVLTVLWDRGPLGVKDTLNLLTDRGQEWTRSTVVTLLRRLEAKRYITSDKSGHAFVYRPLVTREDVIHTRLTELAGELADGDPMPLMLAFAEKHRFSPEALARLQRMVDDLKKRAPRKRGTP